MQYHNNVKSTALLFRPPLSHQRQAFATKYTSQYEVSVGSNQSQLSIYCHVYIHSHGPPSDCQETKLTIYL